MAVSFTPHLSICFVHGEPGGSDSFDPRAAGVGGGALRPALPHSTPSAHPHGPRLTAARPALGEVLRELLNMGTLCRGVSPPPATAARPRGAARSQPRGGGGGEARAQPSGAEREERGKSARGLASEGDIRTPPRQPARRTASTASLEGQSCKTRVGGKGGGGEGAASRRRDAGHRDTSDGTQGRDQDQVRGEHVLQQATVYTPRAEGLPSQSAKANADVAYAYPSHWQTACRLVSATLEHTNAHNNCS